LPTHASREIHSASALAARLHSYHSVTIEQVLDTVAYLRDDGDSVIAGGSLAVGLGNRLSDLDVVIAGGNTSISSRVPLEHFVESLRIDVWKMSQALIDSVFDRAAQGLRQSGRLDELFANLDDEVNLKLLHRIAFGIALDGPGLPASTSHAEIARDVVVREYAERMREHAYLAQLSSRQRRPLAAVVNARDAVEEGLHAAITARGVPFTGHKWLQERLASDAQDLRALYAPFATLPAADTSEAFVASAIALCESLSGVTLNAEGLAPCCGWSNTDLTLAEAGDFPLLLSRKIGGLWQLDEDEAAAWRAMPATDAGEQRAWSCVDLTDAQAALCFTLYECGVLKLTWSDGLTLEELHFDSGALR
jgi:hypothetical protein